MITMNAIQWPKKWIPGETDNFVSNEVIVKGLDFKTTQAEIPNIFSVWDECFSSARNYIKTLSETNLSYLKRKSFILKRKNPV